MNIVFVSVNIYQLKQTNKNNTNLISYKKLFSLSEKQKISKHNNIKNEVKGHLNEYGFYLKATISI